MPKTRPEAFIRPFSPFFTSLKFRFIAALFFLVSVVIGLATWWNLNAHRGHMFRATEDKVRALAEAIDRGIQLAMQKGHTPEVQHLLESMAQDPDIEQIIIFNERGTILRASRPELVGQTLDRDRLSRYLVQRDSSVTRHYEGGNLIQSVVRRIRNRQECHACHGAERELIGTLHMDMSFRRTQGDIIEMERSAFWTVILTGTVMAVGGGILMNRMVDRRVTRLVRAMAKVEAGNLEVRADPGVADELGRLAESFNTMVERLRAARQEIEEYHRHRLERAERLATMGEVAASLAHEIKNPLAGIAGAVGVMAEELEDEDPRKEIMAEILAQIRRLNKTVQDLLTFARPSAPTMETCDIHHVIDRVLLLLAEDPIAKRVRVVRNYQPGLPRLEADGKQLGQVFLNLLLNAAQAMHGDGQVTITTRLNGTSNERTESHGRHVIQVSLADTGPGIPSDILAELFTPFFTTKPRGTGLGLAISRRIVEDHGGWIHAESPPQRGATFHIGLPVGAPIRREEGSA